MGRADRASRIKFYKKDSMGIITKYTHHDIKGELYYSHHDGCTFWNQEVNVPEGKDKANEGTHHH